MAYSDSYLGRFLQKNEIEPAEIKNVPIVHTTRADAIKKFVETDAIATNFCDVFEKHLNYWFVGRPAYKNPVSDRREDIWTLPACVIADFKVLNSIEGLYPFDTGAHKNHIYPEFINDMPLEDFDISGPGIKRTIERLIGAYFINFANYLRLNVRSDFKQHFDLDPLDSTSLALHKLAADGQTKQYDDRRFAIEIQNGARVELAHQHMIAMVLPNAYLESDRVQAKLSEWGIEPVGYDTFSLNYEHYIGMIYEKVFDIYRMHGFPG